MRRDQRRLALEASERVAESCVALVGGPVEPIVRGDLAGRLPDGFHRVEFRRVRRKSVEGDPPSVLGEPALPFVIESMTRTVIDDEEDALAWILRDEVLQEAKERSAGEHLGELETGASVVECNGTEDVSRIPISARINARLLAYSGPRSVEGPVEPEAGLVLEEDDSSARRGFFLIAGKVFRSQTDCASASARANRFLGR